MTYTAKSDPKSVADLISAAKKEKISPMELCERIIDGDQLPLGVKPAIKKNLASFVGVVRKLRRAAKKVSFHLGEWNLFTGD